MANAKDYSGMKFGKLTILGDTGKRENHNQIVIARHDDGRIIEAKIKHIAEGLVTGFNGSEERSKVSSETAKENAVKYKEHLSDWGKKGSKNRTEKYNSEQMFIQTFRKREPNKTGYYGVYWDKSKTIWNVKFEFKEYNINKYFNDFEEAVIFRNNLEIKHMNPVLKRYDEETVEPISQVLKNDFVLIKEKEIFDKLIENKRKMMTSKIKGKVAGVNKRKDNGKWRATIRLDGETINLGTFKNEKDAIKARKEAEEKYFKKLSEKYNKQKGD